MSLIYRVCLWTILYSFATSPRTLQLASSANPSPLYYCSHAFYFDMLVTPHHRVFYICFYHFSIILCRYMFCLVWDSFWLKRSMNNFYPRSWGQWSLSVFLHLWMSILSLFSKDFFPLCIEFWVERMWIIFLFITLTVSLPCLLDCIVSDENSLLIVMFLPLSIKCL